MDMATNAVALSFTPQLCRGLGLPGLLSALQVVLHQRRHVHQHCAQCNIYNIYNIYTQYMLTPHVLNPLTY